MITSTDHVCAAVVKVGFTTICVLLNELAGRFGNVWPAERSRNVTFAPDTKLLPWIVNGCELFEPVTGLGDTLLTDGGDETTGD